MCHTGRESQRVSAYAKSLSAITFPEAAPSRGSSPSVGENRGGDDVSRVQPRRDATRLAKRERLRVTHTRPKKHAGEYGYVPFSGVHALGGTPERSTGSLPTRSRRFLARRICTARREKRRIYILPRIYLRLFSPPPTRSFQCVSADVKYGDCRLFLVDRTASYRNTMLALTLECLDELRGGDLLPLSSRRDDYSALLVK